MTPSKLSHLAETLIGSEIVKLGGVIKEKIRAGESIYNYTIGDFDSSQFPIPESLRTEIVNAYADGYTNYPAAEGELDLRKSVAAFISRKQKLEFKTDEILIAAGGRPLIYSVYRAIVDKGDKVIYPVPSWNNNHYVHFTEGEHVMIEATRENNFMPTAAQMEPHVKGASLIAVCSPLNPTGTTFAKEELEAICDLVIRENNERGENEKKLYLMFDQIYWTLTFGDTVHYDPVSLRPEMKKYTIYIDGISKAFAATGVRVGWALGPSNVIAKMKAINSHIGSWAPMAEQVAVSKFLKNENEVDSYLTHFRNEIEYRLKAIHSGIQMLRSEGFLIDSIAPQAAIYLTVQFSLAGKTKSTGEVLQTQSDVTAYLLDEAKLAIVPFYAFGADRQSDWYRLSVGCCIKDDIETVIENLRRALAKLN